MSRNKNGNSYVVQLFGRRCNWGTMLCGSNHILLRAVAPAVLVEGLADVAHDILHVHT